ncbi:WecB/TagA/CpsF family glycosyltransferase [Apilactobacillus sp. HBW1]|uniref:N-acetylglucosaminyldiphosphoundecaprenol N-acetyl-beta-D-mannosaminyltransferase n=2 Tax=Apilactobacillus waqarii TaxID=2851006 RepID=A0ABS6M4J2_9LACO|nr:WecB/TagA/CpsF family glycosyltransferase [Apilactobacillus waqarii]MBV0915108.1 WecB/TagA/CpsF family glycosyltransferase [Apilactobacillus waqarii]MCL8495839.1 WecB/TagA/CpsF family glycosyltransferase [Apilactobacillus sp. F1]
MENKTVNILGFDFLNSSFNDFMENTKHRIDKHENTFVVTANPEIVVHALNDQKYTETIKKSDYLVADGIGIVMGANILGSDMSERITGYDILLDLLSWSNQNHKSAYFLGAKPEVIADLKKIIPQKYPDLTVSGYHDGYFADSDKIAAEIKQNQPDMVFVALGFPKQEYFIEKYRHVSNGLWIGLGGSFDVLSGHVQRAPQFWINHHIEWLYRLIKEPTRFKRMLALPKFIRLVKKQKKNEAK